MSHSPTSVLRVIEAGYGTTIQDRGRPGWRRFGIPTSGAMDLHAAECANRLLDNPSSAPVLEILFGVAQFEVLRPIWVALTGAVAEANLPFWRAHQLLTGERIVLRQAPAGVWSYLAIEGGFLAPSLFGSSSFYARGGIGKKLPPILERPSGPGLALPKGVSGRMASWEDRRDYLNPPAIRLWRGPQWDRFSAADQERLLTAHWTVSTQSDRVGYRLEGPKLASDPPEIISEPVRAGSIQVPDSGQPIITMRDGPTVGGYPKIALVEELDLSWVAQARPGQQIKFQLIE
jgi:biotin-dependent carboxylase-like uncharacterized protein